MKLPNKIRLNEINKIKDYFSSEIQERKTISKNLSKYTVGFHYTDKILVILSATFCSISIASTATVTVTVIVFSLTTGIIKRLLKITRNKKKKHNKIVMIAKIKLNTIETLISQALIHLEINHEGFKTIINERDTFEEIKEGIRNIKSNE